MSALPAKADVCADRYQRIRQMLGRCDTPGRTIANDADFLDRQILDPPIRLSIMPRLPFRLQSQSASFRRHRYDHRNALAIFDVCITVERDEVAFFQQYTDDDVPGSRNRKQQMPDRHRRCCPKR